MHGSPDSDQLAIDDRQVTALYERTLARSRRLRIRQRWGTVAIATVTVAVLLGVLLVPSASKAPAQPGRPTRWHLVVDVTAQFAAQGVTFEGSTLECPSVSTCFAFADAHGSLDLEVTVDAGGRWTVSAPPGTVNPTSLSCSDPETCAALATTPSGGAFVETTNDGSSWSSNPFPAQASGMATLSCVTAEQCVAVAESSAGSALAMTTEDGGQTWTTTALPVPAASALEVTGLSCFADGRCTLLGSLSSQNSASRSTVSLLSTDGGSTWEPGEVPASFVPGYDFSCSSSTVCLAVGNTASSLPSVIATSDGGATWSEVSVPAPAAPTGTVFINWISCTSAACWVSGGSFGNRASHGFLDESGDRGASWTSTPLPPSVDALGNVSCTAGSTCFALGEESSGAGGQGTLVLLSNAS